MQEAGGKEQEAGKSGGSPAACTCGKDAFAALPPELRPRTQKKGSLRQVTCPGCGLVYWTNRTTEMCMECERKGNANAGS